MENALHSLLALVVIGAGYALLIAKHVVREFECGLLYRNGRFRRQLGPGVCRVPRFSYKVTIVDLRTRVVTVTGQEVLTADQVSIKLSVVVSYAVSEPAKALHQVESYADALYVMVQLAVRRAVGSTAAEQLLEKRLEIGNQLTAEVKPLAERIGLRVDSAEVKDVMLPSDLKRAFSETVRAKKDGQAALERARGETAALRNLANAARMLPENPGLLDLRMLQMLSTNVAGLSVVLNAPNAPASVRTGARPTSTTEESSS